MTILIGIAFVIAGALAWRIRGGWLGLPSTTLGRLVPSVLYGGFAYWLGVPLLFSIALIPSLWIGLIWPWAQWMDMGHVREDDDLIGMTGRGFLITVLPGLLLWNPALVAAGGLMGPIYWAAWYSASGSVSSAPRFQWNSFIDGPTAIGELVTGGMIFATLWAVV